MQPTRRKFLALGIGLVAAATLHGCANLMRKRQPDLVESPSGGTLQIPQARFPQVAGPDDSVLILNRADSQRILVVRESAGRYAAVGVTCPHCGGDVRYNAGRGYIVCRFDGSEFDMAGKNRKGPATKPLRHYPARIAEGLIVITVAGG